MRAGDSIVQFEGSNVPFVLRAQNTRTTSFYQVIGAAYIPSSMQKEALDQALSEGARMEVVELR